MRVIELKLGRTFVYGSAQRVTNIARHTDVKFNLVDRGVCPLCRSDRASVHIGFIDIPVHRCNDCQFLFSGKLMRQEDLDRYYRDDFGSERHRRGQLVNATINARMLRALVPGDAFASVRSLLDVGTGYGFLLRELRDRYQLSGVGVELSAQESAYGRNTLGLDIRTGPLARADLPKASFDMVTSFEVIEHVTDPIQFLHEMLEYVRPGGWLLTMTDNFESRVARDLSAAFPKWIPHSHISHFAPATLERAMTANGCTLVRRGSYTPWELVLKDFYYRVKRLEVKPEDAFDLRETLQTEMNGRYVLFNTRRLVNRFWARATLANNLDGALMYCLAQKGHA
jgi:SAM-dependent methyltransferase